MPTDKMSPTEKWFYLNKKSRGERELKAFCTRHVYCTYPEGFHLDGRWQLAIGFIQSHILPHRQKKGKPMFPEMADVHLWCSLIENWPAKSSMAYVCAFGETAFSTISTTTAHTHLVHANYSTFSLSLQHNLKPTHWAQGQRVQNMQPGHAHTQITENQGFFPSAAMHMMYFVQSDTQSVLQLKIYFRDPSFWIKFWELRVKANRWPSHPSGSVHIMDVMH